MEFSVHPKPGPNKQGFHHWDVFNVRNPDSIARRKNTSPAFHVLGDPTQQKV